MFLASYLLLSTVAHFSNPAVVATEIEIDSSARTPISPLIYGINSVDYAGMGTGFGFARQGGNRMSAYNWENNASNAGNDYHFQNDGYMGATDEPGWLGRTFVQAAHSHASIPILTVPTVGYVSADKKGDGDVRKTPNYLAVRFKKSVAVKPGHQYVYPPDLTDGVVYEDEFVAYMRRFASAKAPIYFDLDNEPDLWSSTHAEVHPNPLTYAELLSNNITYAAAIKSVYPQTKVFGFVSYGWGGFRTLQNAPDAKGRDFLDFYLEGLRQSEKVLGRRLVDVLDLHWYPEARGGGKRVTENDDNSGVAEARIQAPRSLWDSSYVEDSWITQSNGKKPIRLLPDTFAKINTHYPGTKLAFTEYNFGGNNHISGALAQADVLGIFGRWGVFAAANWGVSAGDRGELAGFNAFINFDRRGARFGDMALRVKGESAAQNSVYAAIDRKNPHRLTMVVLNKLSTPQTFNFKLSKVGGSMATAYLIAGRNFGSPEKRALKVSGGRISLSLPALSLATIEVR